MRRDLDKMLDLLTSVQDVSAFKQRLSELDKVRETNSLEYQKGLEDLARKSAAQNASFDQRMSDLENQYQDKALEQREAYEQLKNQLFSKVDAERQQYSECRRIQAENIATTKELESQFVNLEKTKQELTQLQQDLQQREVKLAQKLQRFNEIVEMR